MLARVDSRLVGAPTAPAALAERAEVLFTLHRLQGGEQDLIDAAAAIDTAWANKGETLKSVRRAKATLLQKNHKFREALTVLEALNDPPDVAFKASLRFELGEYADALKTLDDLVAGQKIPDPGIEGRRAVCLWKLGRFDEAEAALASAERNYHGRDQWVHAWHHLLLGLMDLDRDRLDDAMAHYRAADAAYPGWWLIEEHIAEIHLLQSRPLEALPIYERVVAATGNPELIASWADALDAAGKADEAKATRERAMAAFDDHVKRNPTGMGGHALEFYLEHGDPQRALALAKANVDLRPNGDAKRLLADALEATGDKAGAEALRAEVAASGWWSPPSP